MTDKSVAERLKALQGIAWDTFLTNDVCDVDKLVAEIAAIRAEVEAVAKELRASVAHYDDGVRPQHINSLMADRLSREP